MNRRVVYQQHVEGLSHEIRVILSETDEVLAEWKYFDALGEPAWTSVSATFKETVLCCAIVALAKGQEQ